MAAVNVAILVRSKANPNASPTSASVETGINRGPFVSRDNPRLAKEFNIEASNFKFFPAEIRVKKGDVVWVTILDLGGEHDFQLDEFAASTRILHSGEKETIEFTAGTSGTFEFYCSVGNHRARGMKGKLIVE